MSDTLIGRKLGDYVIQEILGRGGMAHVYRGYDPNLQRFAAVKVIDSRLLSKGHEEEYRARFRREARAIAKLAHPNIVGVYQFGEFGPLYYMAMEFIDGRDLGQILKSNATTSERISARQIVRIVHDIAGALDYAHVGNVIHRDVKPSNIMVTNDERAVLTDFGLALDVPEGTGGNTFGSAHYIAPEQAISSRNAVPQSDLYSLGVVLYQMVTGRVPFDDSSAMSVALKHLSDDPPPPRSVDPSISPAVEKVILKALEKEPSKRFKNGEVMARALEEAMNTAPIELGALDSPSQASRPMRLNLPTETSPKRNTREMESIGSKTIDFVDKDVTSARDAILRAKNRSLRPHPVTIAVAVLAVIALLVGIVAILRENGGTTNPTATDGSVAALVETDTAAPESTLQPTRGDTPTRLPSASARPSEIVSPSEAASTDGTEPVDTAAVSPTDANALVVLGSTASNTPRPTRTPGSTVTASASPSRTPRPTATPTPTPSLVPTNKPTAPAGSISGGAVISPDAPIVLVYDSDQLVLWNRSDHAVNVSPLVFSQQTSAGLVTFSATTWATNFINVLPAGDCLMLWRIGIREAPTPDYCHERQAWFAVGTPRRFWLNADSSAMFSVYLYGQEVATCPVNLGDCGIDF